MAIEITCKCGKFLSVNDEFAGQRQQCPNCQKWLTLPKTPNRKTEQPAAANRKSRKAETKEASKRAKSDTSSAEKPSHPAKTCFEIVLFSALSLWLFSDALTAFNTGTAVVHHKHEPDTHVTGKVAALQGVWQLLGGLFLAGYALNQLASLAVPRPANPSDEGADDGPRS